MKWHRVWSSRADVSTEKSVIMMHVNDRRPLSVSVNWLNVELMINSIYSQQMVQNKQTPFMNKSPPLLQFSVFPCEANINAYKLKPSLCVTISRDDHGTPSLYEVVHRRDFVTCRVWRQCGFVQERTRLREDQLHSLTTFWLKWWFLSTATCRSEEYCNRKRVKLGTVAELSCFSSFWLCLNWQCSSAVTKWLPMAVITEDTFGTRTPWTLKFVKLRIESTSLTRLDHTWLILESRDFQSDQMSLVVQCQRVSTSN